MSQSFKSFRFGQYRFLGKIGEGGMAEIYRAEAVDERGELHTVVLKLLKPNLPPAAVEQFDFEADLMGLLEHPNLVRRLEVGQAGARRFLAMEDVFGGDLASLIAAARRADSCVPQRVALRVVVEVLHGLAYFHQARSAGGEPLELVHSDISPDNIFVSAHGEVKLGDFGISTARSPAAAESGLPEGVTAGKVSYLSPEQAAGDPATPSSDLFSVGVVLYELLVGHRPFEALDTDELLNRVYQAKVKIPRGLLDKELTRTLRRALARSPKDRFRSAGELCGELVRYQLDHGLQCPAQALREHIAGAFGVLA